MFSGSKNQAKLHAALEMAFRQETVIHIPFKKEGLREIDYNMSMVLYTNLFSEVSSDYSFLFGSLLQNATAILFQNATKVYYKMLEIFCYKMWQFYYKLRHLLRKCHNFLTKCDSYYKMRHHIWYDMIYLFNFATKTAAHILWKNMTN